MSKIDPSTLASKLDRRSTMLFQVARSQTESMDEKSLTGIEDPGMDALRGSFGTFGSIIRARSARRASQSSARSRFRTKSTGAYDPTSLSWISERERPSTEVQGLPLGDPLSGLTRHQLYDAPVPRDDASSARSVPASTHSQSAPTKQPSTKRTTIKFGDKDVVHQYNRPGTGDNRATHEHRTAQGIPATFSPPPTARVSQTTRLSFTQEPPAEEELVIVDSPEQLLNLIEIGDTSKQTVLVPPDISKEHQVMSAPPTFKPRFQPVASGSGTGRDYRDVFSGTPSTATLKTFPSVNDTASSEVVWDEEEVERQKEMARARDRLRSLGIGGKRYPRLSADDDAEESERLWHRRSGAAADLEPTDENGDEHDTDDPLAGPTGGIRLVQPSKPPEL